jgi:hypothetical protein
MPDIPEKNADGRANGRLEGFSRPSDEGVPRSGFSLSFSPAFILLFPMLLPVQRSVRHDFPMSQVPESEGIMLLAGLHCFATAIVENRYLTPQVLARVAIGW